MKNFRAILKETLINKGYPIQISEEGIKKCHTKGIGYEHIKKAGIKLERKVYKNNDMQKTEEEVITIYTNGFISQKEMQEIVDECKKTYNAKAYNYNIKRTDIYIF